MLVGVFILSDFVDVRGSFKKFPDWADISKS